MEIKRSTLDRMVGYAKFFSMGIIIAAAFYITNPFWLPFVRQDPYIGSDKAAVRGAESFFSIDAATGYEAWLKSLCDVSTKAGCDLTKAMVETSGMWKQVEAQNTKRQVKAQALEMVDTAKDGTVAAVWKIQLKEASGDKTSEIFVAVAKEDDQWKFERYLLKQEAERYTNKGDK